MSATAGHPFFCLSARHHPCSRCGCTRRGTCATAVRANLSLPGLLPPVRHGDDLLLDGGLLNNLPVDVMRERLDGGTVIAVDLGVEVEMRVPEGYQETPTGWQLLALRLKQRGRGEPLPSLIGVLQRAKELAAIRGAPAVDGAPRRPAPPPAGRERPALDFPGGARPRRGRLPLCAHADAGGGLGGPPVVTAPPAPVALSAMIAKTTWKLGGGRTLMLIGGRV